MRGRRGILCWGWVALVLLALGACDRQDNQWGVFDEGLKVLSVETDTLSLVEGGGAAVFHVALPMVPADTVRVAIVSTDSQAVATPETLLFVPRDDDWSVPQVVTVVARDDVIDEGPHSAMLSVLVSSLDAGYDGQGGVDLIPLRISDNDRAGVHVSALALTVMESRGGILTEHYDLHLQSQPLSAVTIGLAATPFDSLFHLEPDSLVFTPANWDTAQVVGVWSELDELSADDMALLVHHIASSADSNYTGALEIADVAVEVLDNTLLPTASLTLGAGAAAAISEAGGGVGIDVVVALNRASTVPVTVHLATVEGSAVGGVDFVVLDQDVVFAPGDALAQTFSLVPVDDQVVEFTETLQMIITPVANGLVAGQNRLDLTILDDDQVAVSVRGGAVNEDDGVAVFTVSIPFAAPLPVAFTLTTNDGTATAGSDYTAVAASFVIAPGDTVRRVPVTVVADPAHEGDENLTAVLSGLSANTSWDGVPAQMTLLDDDPQTITFNNIVASEAGPNAVFVLDLAASYNEPLVLTLNTANGDGLGSVSGPEDAIGGADFSTVTHVVWTVPAGVQRDSFQVALLRDSTPEAALEFFRLSVVSASQPGFAGLEAQCTIRDEDQPQIAVSDSVAAETDLNAYFKVAVLDQSGQPVVSQADVSFDFETLEQTATGDVDYTTTRGTVVIPAGSSGAEIAVPLIDDIHDDDNETFILHLSAPVNTLLPSTGSVPFCTIVDNEFPSINLEQTIGAENEGSTHVFTVSMTTQRQSPTGFRLTLDPGTSAGVGVDYDFTGGGYLMIPPFTSALSFAVSFLDDQLDGELDEVLQAQITNAEVALGVVVMDMTITDAPALNIEPDAAVEGIDLVFNVTLTAPSTADIVFSVQYSSGTANVALDIDGSNTGPFTMPAGTTTFAVVTPTVAGDGGDFAVEDFVVTMINPVNAILGPFNSAVGTIYDGDPPALDLAGDATSVEGTDVVFTVNLSWTSGAPVDFYVAFADGTAAGAGIDFADFNTGPYTVPAGALSTTVAVPTMSLDGPELAVEDFTVQVLNPVNGVLGSVINATGFIQDGDQPALSVAAGDTVIEGGTLAFRLHLDTPTIVPVLFNLAFGDGSTQGAADYLSPGAGPYSMMPGTVDTMIMVATVDDTIFENTEQFVVRVGAGPTNAVVGVPPQANGVIIDND